MLNPDCTPGWTEPQKGPDGLPTALHVACCGCGWSEPGYDSKSAAKRAQREHRFPGPNPHLAAAGRRKDPA